MKPAQHKRVMAHMEKSAKHQEAAKKIMEGAKPVLVVKVAVKKAKKK
jgi:hypothetical protein